MAVTIKAVLRKDKENSKGLCPVSIRITIDRATTYKSTGKACKPNQFKDGAYTSAYPNYDVHNAALTKRINAIERELIGNSYVNDIELNVSHAKQVLNPVAEKNNFHEYAQIVLETYENAGSKRRYAMEQQHLKTYAPKLAFTDINKAWLNKYLDYQIKTLKHHNNTALNAFKWIRKVMNHAKDRGYIHNYPFNDWKMPPYKDTDKPYLTLEECMRIYDLLSDEHIEMSVKEVAAYFLVECFAGIRVSDWGRFTVEKIDNEEALKVKAKKTGQPVYIYLIDYPVLSQVLQFIKDNGLHWHRTDKDARERLITIRSLAKIPKHITTHTGRHTCATIHLQKMYSRERIAEILGVTIKIVDTYAKMTRQKGRIESARLGGF